METIKKYKAVIIAAVVGGLVVFIFRKKLDNVKVLRALPTL